MRPCVPHCVVQDSHEAHTEAASIQLLNKQEHMLRQWIHENGGYVHKSLTLVNDAPCGTRGVMAAKPITLTDLEAGPVISIPQSLQFSRVHAEQVITNCLPQAQQGMQAKAALSMLDGVQLLSAALAYEYQQGDTSFWYPYLQLLPSTAPSPSLLSPQQLQLDLQRYGARAANWGPAVAQHRDVMHTRAAAVAAAVGSILQGIDLDTVLWAMGLIQSRSLTSGSYSGLLPYIDLLNHSASARAPMLQLDDNDALVMTVVPIRHDEAHCMIAGEELYIHYAGDFSPLEYYLKFGFVPDEMWPADA
eukprot:jgi/Chrzof1/8545/Cz03g15050.t1